MEDQLGLHLREYAVKCRANAAEMQRVWQDLEVSESARQVELGEAMSEACNAWSNALHRCTQHKAEVAAQISALVDQTSTIAEELGEASNAETREAGLGRTIIARRQSAAKDLADWKDRRAARMSQVEELQAEINELRSRVGLQRAPLLGRQSLTLEAMEGQRIEIGRLQEECQQRTQTLEGMLASLSAQCAELGEDLGDLAAEAHASLKGLRDIDGAVQGLSDAADLSDRTFKALDEKAARLRKLKAERKRQAGMLLEVLKELCNVLDIKSDSVEQRSCISLMESAASVHTASLDKVKAEIEVLHGRKADAMRAATQAQRRELEDICMASHMAVPPMPHALSTDAALSGAALCTQVAEVMAKVGEQVRNAEDEAERRSGVLSALEGIASMRAECAWLASYEKDDARFKGRDANRNLQRSLKAGKVREQLPAAVHQLAAAVARWQDECSSPFIYDGRPLQEVLSTMLEEVQEESRQRMEHHKSQGGRRGSDVGMGTKGGTIAFGRRQDAPGRAPVPSGRTPASATKVCLQKQTPQVPKLPLRKAQKTEDPVRPLSAQINVTPPLTARKAQSSRLKGLNEKVEKLLQSCSPAQTMTTPASEASQGSPQRRMHSPATPFLDVTPASTQARPDALSSGKLVSPLSVSAAAGKWDGKT